MRVFLWITLIVVVVFVSPITRRISNLGGQCNTVIHLELACKPTGEQILKSWSTIKYKDGTLLDQARLDTYWDFVFIAIYVLLIIVESKSFMAKEPIYGLNELLRMNMFLAVIAGFLDVIENFLILHNIGEFGEPDSYVSSYWPSLIKFIFAAWCIIVWLIAIIHQIVLYFTKPTSPSPHIVLLNSVNYSKEANIKLRAMGKFDIVAYLTDNKNSIEYRVKDAIIYTYGDNDPNPTDIADDRALADLNFQDADFLKLTQRFNVIIEAEKPGAPGVDVGTVKGLTAVQDCIDLVTKSSN